MRMQRLATVMMDTVEFWDYRRSGKYHLAETGRWGPAWLHRLLLKAARNLGMLRHEVIADPRTENQKVVVYDYDAKVGHQVEAVLLAWIDRDWSPSDLEIVGGPEFWGMMYHDVGREITFDLPIDLHQMRYGQHLRYAGIKARVIPHLQGWAVLPLRS